MAFIHFSPLVKGVFLLAAGTTQMLKTARGPLASAVMVAKVGPPLHLLLMGLSLA
jgi:hypothetical protein